MAAATTKARWIGALDQGTTSTRFILFDRDGRMGPMVQREHRQITPEPGWVEHDPAEIWANAQAVIGQLLDANGIAPAEIAALGITNQRETTVLWHRETGRALHNAIVWQDGRVAPLVSELASQGGADRFRAATGLPLSTYFSAPKIRWLIDHVPAVSDAIAQGTALFGTIDTFLLWHLTGGAQGGLHVTDVTNASRTQLFNLKTLDWDQTLLDAFGVPRAILPRIVSSSAVIGEARAVLPGVPIAGVLGDQQAALVGQACFAPGATKCTYGTGCFLLTHTGATPIASRAGLITTIAYRFGDAPAAYALEGSVAVAGSLVQWLRDNIGLIRRADEIEALAGRVADNGGLYLVPAFAGLFAPHWNAGARGLLIGLTRYAESGHIARASLEAVALQVCDLMDAIAEDCPLPVDAPLRVDGGMVANRLLMQIQADLLDRRVIRPECIETTALGAAYAAGLATGVWQSTDEIAERWRMADQWQPSMAPGQHAQIAEGWRRAVARALDWEV